MKRGVKHYAAKTMVFSDFVHNFKLLIVSFFLHLALVYLMMILASLLVLKTFITWFTPRQRFTSQMTDYKEFMTDNKILKSLRKNLQYFVLLSPVSSRLSNLLDFPTMDS